MNPKALLIVGLLIVFGIGAYLVSDTTTETAVNNSSESSTGSIEQTGPDIPVEAPSRLITAEEVALHTAKDDCWTIIGDNVYDITPYVPRHPGGINNILKACGTDGSSLFNERQEGDGSQVGSGTPHSSRAAGQLAELVIGSLEQ
jgi:hypothetical protein